MMGEATVQAVVDGMIRFNPREVHPRAIAHLLRDLSFPNPEYISRVRYGRWVGTTPEGSPPDVRAVDPLESV